MSVNQTDRSIELLNEKLNQDFSGHFIEAVLENSPDVVMIVNEAGQILFTNERCKDLLGYTKKELIGKSVEMLLPQGYTDTHRSMRHDYHGSPSVRAMGHRTVLNTLHKSGEMIPVHIALSPLPALPGQERLVQAVLRDAMSIFTAQQNLILQSVAMHDAANGIVITDANGIIQWVNPAVTNMTGYTSEELIGRGPSLLRSGQHDAKFYKTLWETVLGGEHWFGEIINRRKDGTLYYEEQHITPVRSNDGPITHLIAIKQDVTKRREAEIQLQSQLLESERLTFLLNQANYQLEIKVQERTAELAKANEQLKELDNLKSSFIGVISHELRTPFTSIVASIKLLEADGLENLRADQRDLLNLLSESIQSAYSMIENLVDYASFVRKQGLLNLNICDISIVINKVIRAFQAKADRKNIILEAEIPQTSLAILCDEERIYEALRELVDNAVKFTPHKGKVTLSCWIADNHLHFSIEDTGPGIPSDKLNSLWESFTQMADPFRRGREGLGLGLALVEYVVRAHRGKVFAASQVGMGSNFGFRIPEKQ
jgi:PAS domain S-box-containing protein